jgi:UDP-N-acetylglucosamine 2-epimerase (non-hydrolysing)
LYYNKLNKSDQLFGHGGISWSLTRFKVLMPALYKAIWKSMNKKIAIIAGARPNFMKIAPLIKEINKRKRFNFTLVHTGQHYDSGMSKIFFSGLGIPQPDRNLGVGSMSNTAQRAKIMEALEPVFLEEKPDLVLVVGDVNSTVAAAMTASDYGIPVAHVEAGLRSFDMTMPEEINRILTDRLSRFLFVTEELGVQNLQREGIDEKRIFFVGNVMIDNLVSQMPRIENTRFSIPGIRFMVVTLHRPSNVDRKEKLRSLMQSLEDISRDIALIFPIHPRTRKNLDDFKIDVGREIDLSELGDIRDPDIYMLSPLGYNEFMKLVKNSLGLITDSGGIQEETTFLGIPCFTIRENTERPITIEMGTNILIGSDTDRLKGSIRDLLNGKLKTGEIPQLWDGKAASRILDVLEEHL